MAKDCYWKHGATKEQRYICLDNKNEVCSRCCVECCPIETPEWFVKCTEAGHPTWLFGLNKVPKKLVCLESSWDRRVFHNLSVKGFFESLRPLIHPPLQVAHRYIESMKHLAYYTRKRDGLLWTDTISWDCPVFYLAFHGTPGAIQTTLERIGPKALCDAFKDFGGYPNIIYFGSCSVLREVKFGRELLRISGSKAIIGYKESVGWMDSLVVDLLFLYRFYTDDDPWKNLTKIFKSILRDFKPARKMGYTLLPAG